MAVINKRKILNAIDKYMEVCISDWEKEVHHKDKPSSIQCAEISGRMQVLEVLKEYITTGNVTASRHR